MELGHILSGQIILISSLLATIFLAESTKSASSLAFISRLSFIKVSGEKGSILLLFSISSFFLFLLDFASSQAKISGCKVLSKNLKRASFQHVKGLLALFVAFICSYIFQSLSFRVNNLFGIALIVLNLKSLLSLIGFSMLKTWLYVVFIICNLLIFLFTFIKHSESVYTIMLTYLKIRF